MEWLCNVRCRLHVDGMKGVDCGCMSGVDCGVDGM
jgi:hypothetical protein